MEDNIKKLRIKELDARLKNLDDNINQMQLKKKELIDKKTKLLSENLIYDELHLNDLITNYIEFIELRLTKDQKYKDLDI
jgi:hypothetical protein